MGGYFCQILELGGTTIKGRRVHLGPVHTIPFLNKNASV